MSDEDIKSFKDLTIEVQEKGICGKCGGCVSFCSAGELNALEIAEDGGPRFIDEEKCLKCGICYLICPQIEVLNSELKEKRGWKAPIGSYRKLTSARTTNNEIRNICTDGGVVTSLLIYALEKHLIQGAIVSKKTDPFTRQPVLVTQPDELIKTAGSYFDKTLHLEEIGRKYTTYSPVIREIGSLGRGKLESIAMVGTPCQIYTVRKMQLLNVIPADMVTLTIGLFCMENFSFDENARDKLEKKLKIELKDVEKLNIKDDVIVTLEKGEIIHLPFEAVDEIARPACFACPDFANDYADISVGGLGSPDGYTTTIIRSGNGEKIYNSAKNDKSIEELSFKSREDLRIHKTEIMAKIVSFSRRKKERAKKREPESRKAREPESIEA
ncbi:MAG: Coenzyme F420 hydrogenase/dehydrogenase, beta subunit C-terminal domain [Candidatus Heimdallarchaeota archaeon]